MIGICKETAKCFQKLNLIYTIRTYEGVEGQIESLPPRIIYWQLTKMGRTVSAELEKILMEIPVRQPYGSYLRNEFNLWNVHGIMNTSDLLQSKWSLKGFMWLHVNFARDPKYSWFHEHSKNWIQFCLFCAGDSGVARCQSQHRYPFWWMNSMFKAYCMGKWAWQLSIKLVQFMRQWTVAKI